MLSSRPANAEHAPSRRLQLPAARPFPAVHPRPFDPPRGPPSGGSFGRRDCTTSMHETTAPARFKPKEQ
jgi:hypothetical protein